MDLRLELYVDLVDGTDSQIAVIVDLLTDADRDWRVQAIYLPVPPLVRHDDTGMAIIRQRDPRPVDEHSAAYRALRDAIQLQCTDRIREAIAGMRPEACEYLLEAAE